MIYPLGEPEWRQTLLEMTFHQPLSSLFVCFCSTWAHVCVCPCCFSALAMLTYLVASFVGLLHQHPPLVVQLHGHAAAAVGVLPHPAEELLQLPPQGGVRIPTGLGVTGARHQSLCRAEGKTKSWMTNFRKSAKSFNMSLNIKTYFPKPIKLNLWFKRNFIQTYHSVGFYVQ